MVSEDAFTDMFSASFDVAFGKKSDYTQEKIITIMRSIVVGWTSTDVDIRIKKTVLDTIDEFKEVNIHG